MGGLDRLVGLDDARDRRERAPLWQRALWRGLKRLVRKYPRAALSATAAGARYAVAQGAREGAEALGEMVNALRTAPAPSRETDVLPPPEGVPDAPPPPAKIAPDCEPPVRHTTHLTEEQRQELVNSLSSEDCARLAELARETE